MMVGRALLAVAAGTCAVAAAAPAHAAGPVPDAPKIEVLSNRADLISGGDALVRITLPARAQTWNPRVKIGNRRDVTDQLTRTGPRTIEGVVSGFKNGKNLLQVRLKDGSAAGIVVTNHPQGGPVFAGPQIQPWLCQKGSVDEQCNQPPKYSYVYRSTDVLKIGFQDYDPDDPPRDVATTTTVSGRQVPFIVRIETGYIARDEYKIATLMRPGERRTGVSSQPQFAHRLLVTHGGNCNIQYGPDDAPSVLAALSVGGGGLLGGIISTITNDPAVSALGKGYAVMSTAASNSGHNCNLQTQAESLVMTKERVIERYGTLDYTIGVGCSGGALSQYWVANAYPGIYDGILPTCSFPDAWSAAIQVMDYHLLRKYFEEPSRWFGENAFTGDQTAAVYGHNGPLNAIISDIGFFEAIVPDRECDPLKPEQIYDPKKNIDGVRCSLADFNLHIFGRRDPASWGANEKKLGYGFANVPVDNTGVQYGLDALRRGVITREQFVDLNEKIGALDVDIKPTKERLDGESPALAASYRTGGINEANNLGSTPIIDCRGPDPGFAHDSFRPYAVRARLDRALGGHGNQVIFSGGVPIIGDTRCSARSFEVMERWVAAIKADASAAPLEQKVLAAKPADARDVCLDGGGNVSYEGQCSAELMPVYGTPRMVAGDQITTDKNKCRLKPLVRGDYAPMTFSDAQWQRLVKTFPTGVCDYSQPAVGQQPTVPWLEFSDSRGRVITGGRPMGPAPVSFGM